MNKEWEWKLRYMRLYGEFTGFLGALAYWDLPEELMDKVVTFADDLEERHEKMMLKDEESGDNSEDSDVPSGEDEPLSLSE